MRIATDSILQPLSTQKTLRSGHPFTLIFIEHGSGAAVLSSCGFVAVEWIQSFESVGENSVVLDDDGTDGTDV